MNLAVDASTLIRHLAMRGSPDTVLRAVRTAVLPGHETPRILGVDDVAFRRGRRYGTLLIDLERRCRVDLLPERIAATTRRASADKPRRCAHGSHSLAFNTALSFRRAPCRVMSCEGLRRRACFTLHYKSHTHT